MPVAELLESLSLRQMLIPIGFCIHQRTQCGKVTLLGIATHIVVFHKVGGCHDVDGGSSGTAHVYTLCRVGDIAICRHYDHTFCLEFTGYPLLFVVADSGCDGVVVYTPGNWQRGVEAKMELECFLLVRLDLVDDDIVGE